MTGFELSACCMPAQWVGWLWPYLAMGWLLALAALVLAGSKGGFVGAALGFGILLALSIAKRRRPLWTASNRVPFFSTH